MRDKWIETKKEYEIDAQGNLKPTKITHERIKTSLLGLEKKDFLDLLIKIIGLSAIVIPIFLYYKSNTAEINKQKSIRQFDIYSSVTTELQNIVNKPFLSPEYLTAKDRLLFELKPKVSLLGDSNVIKYFSLTEKSIAHSIDVYNEWRFIDTVLTYAEAVSSDYQWPWRSDTLRKPISDKVHSLLVSSHIFFGIISDFEKDSIEITLPNPIFGPRYKWSWQTAYDDLFSFPELFQDAVYYDPDLKVRIDNFDKFYRYTGIATLKALKFSYGDFERKSRRNISTLADTLSNLMIEANSKLTR
jgi:hypothetical protein